MRYFSRLKFMVITITASAVILSPFISRAFAQRICLDGLHGNLLFHDGRTFKEPLATEVLAEYEVEMIGPFGSHFEPGIRLTDRLLSTYGALICYLPIDPFTPKELRTIKRFVNRGGGLLLVADNGEDQGLAAANQVASLFGARFVNCVTAAPRAVKTFVLGEYEKRYVPDMRMPYFFEARVGDHPVVQRIQALPVRAAGAIEGGLPIAWTEGDESLSDLANRLWLDRCNFRNVHHPDKYAEPTEVRDRTVVLAALSSGKGRVVFWADALLTRFSLEGYGGTELKETITAVTRNIISWLIRTKPNASSLHNTHPLPGIPNEQQYVFFRYQLGRLHGEAGKVEVTGPHGYCTTFAVDPNAPFHFSTGRAAPGEYKLDNRRILVIAERRLHVLNGDETHPDDMVHASRGNTLAQDRSQALRILKKDQQTYGFNHMADYPCWDPLTACQAAGEYGMEIGTIYRGWMLKPVGSLAGPQREHGFVFHNLPDFVWGIQTGGYFRSPYNTPNNGLAKLMQIYNTPGFLFWNAGGGNEPTMAYLDAESTHDLHYYRDLLYKWGYTPADIGVHSWEQVRPHPLCDEFSDVLNENRNPFPDTVLRPAADARHTPIGNTSEELLSWHLSNWAALKMQHDKMRCGLRLAKILYPDLITLGSHEADWPYYFDNIALARGGHQWIEPGEMMSVHGWCSPMSGLSYQAGAMVEIEQARFNQRHGAWIRYKNFTGHSREDILATDELFEHTYATALAHGACMFGVEKAAEIGPRGGREESKEFLDRANRLRAVWLNLTAEPSQIAVYRPGTHSLKAIQEDVNWGWIATVRGLGGAQVNYLFRWNLRRGDLKSYKVLLLFGCHLLEKDIAECIIDWVMDGGILIGDLYSGRFNERYKEQFWLQEVFGARPKTEPMQQRPDRIELKLKGRPLIMAGIHPDTPLDEYRELEKPDPNTKVLARFWHSGPAITTHPYGKGTGILVGLRMGREQWRRGHSPGLEDMLGTLVRRHHTPLAQTNRRDVEVGVWDGGAIKYLILVRHIPPPPPTTRTDREVVALDSYESLETEIRVKGAWNVIQLLGSENTQLLGHRIPTKSISDDETRFSAFVNTRDFYVYAIFPKKYAPRRLEVKSSPALINIGQTAGINIELDTIGYTPVDLEITIHGGRLYGDQLLLIDGRKSYQLATAPNDPPGDWTIHVRDLIFGLEATFNLKVLAPAQVRSLSSR